MPVRLLNRGYGPWNKGLLVGQKKPLEPKHVWSIRVRLEIALSKRDLAIFNLAIDSKLRACDLVKLRLDDVYLGNNVRHRATVVQKKTGRPSSLRSQSNREVQLKRGCQCSGRMAHDFCSQVDFMPALTYRRANIHGWSIKSIGLEAASYGTHSMRRTKAAQIYRKTGNLRAIQLLLGHTKLESTVRYLGIEVDDALSMAEQIDL
jgi:integrase